MEVGGEWRLLAVGEVIGVALVSRDLISLTLSTLRFLALVLGKQEGQGIRQRPQRPPDAAEVWETPETPETFFGEPVYASGECFFLPMLYSGS